MSTPFIGQISSFAFSFAPAQWAFCNGSQQAISSNQALFALIGTFYGGDGRSTFGLPHLTSRSTTGFSMGNPLNLIPFHLGMQGGAQYETLGMPHLPTHTHAASFTPAGGGNAADIEFQVTTEDGTASQPSNGDYLAQPSELQGPDKRELMYKTSQPSPDSFVSLGGVSGNDDISGNVALDNSGNNQAFAMVNPFTAVNFSIALLGTFPPRN